MYRKTCKSGAERNLKNAHGLILMKNKFLSSPEPGMGKIEADLLHLKCKTEKPCREDYNLKDKKYGIRTTTGKRGSGDDRFARQ